MNLNTRAPFMNARLKFTSSITIVMYKNVRISDLSLMVVPMEALLAMTLSWLSILTRKPMFQVWLTLDLMIFLLVLPLVPSRLLMGLLLSR